MKKLYGFYKTKNKDLKHIATTDYSTKQKLKADMQSNGFKNVKILSEIDIENLLNNSNLLLAYEELIALYIAECIIID